MRTWLYYICGSHLKKNDLYFLACVRIAFTVSTCSKTSTDIFFKGRGSLAWKNIVLSFGFPTINNSGVGIKKQPYSVLVQFCVEEKSQYHTIKSPQTERGVQ